MCPNQFILQNNHQTELCFCNDCRARKYAKVSQLDATRGNYYKSTNLPMRRERKAEVLKLAFLVPNNLLGCKFSKNQNASNVPLTIFPTT